MIESLRVRWVIILIVLAVALIWTVPNFVPVEKIGWWPTKNKMVLGLDIQGGSHLVLRVDVDAAVKQDATRTAVSLPREIAEQKKITLKDGEVVDPLRGIIRYPVASEQEAKAFTDYIDENYSQAYLVSESNASSVTIEYAELYLRDFKSKLLDRGIL